MPLSRSIFQRAVAMLHEQDGEVLVVRSPLAPLNAEPRVSSAQISQLLAGHTVLSLERDATGEWYRVRGGDGYEGWTHSGYLMPVNSGWEPSTTLSLGARVHGPYGERDLPLGALLLPGEEVVAGGRVELSELATRFPTSGSAILESARRFFGGVSYQWGGITPWGCDCSGFVQTLFALHGVALPRDAWQQAMEGDEVAADPDRGELGELLFFSDRDDGRVTHVALRAGGDRIVHVAIGRGGMSQDSLGGGEGYLIRLRSQLRAARRVLHD